MLFVKMEWNKIFFADIVFTNDIQEWNKCLAKEDIGNKEVDLFIYFNKESAF